MDRMVNNIQLTWKLAWVLRTYRTCNSMVSFSKYEFYNKLLGGDEAKNVCQSIAYQSLWRGYIPCKDERERH